MSNRKQIILHGHLAKLYPHEIFIEADTVAEAIAALADIQELQPETGEPWPITIQGVDTQIALYSPTSLAEIHVYPRTGGAGGRGGLMQIIIGIAVVAIGVMNPAFLGAFGLSQGSLILSGGLMVVGGLLQMLMPVPQLSSTTEDSSRYLGASGNTVKIGTRITLAYGFRRLGGQYLSFDVDAVEWAGEDQDLGDATIVSDSVYVEYDKQPVEMAILRPIYPAAVASPTNIPQAA